MMNKQEKKTIFNLVCCLDKQTLVGVWENLMFYSTFYAEDDNNFSTYVMKIIEERLQVIYKYENDL